MTRSRFPRGGRPAPRVPPSGRAPVPRRAGLAEVGDEPTPERLEELLQELEERVEVLEAEIDDKGGLNSRLTTLEENFTKVRLYLERIVIISMEAVRFYLRETHTGDIPLPEARRFVTKVRTRINNLIRLIKFRRSTVGRVGNRTIQRRRK